MNRSLAVTVLALVSLVGCDRSLPSAPAAQLDATLPPTGARGLTVMTRNLYLGADLDPLLAESDPNQIPFLAAHAFQAVLASDFPERAQALAGEIAAVSPHLVGLQEVSTYRVQSPGDAAFGGTTPATHVVIDFLPTLLAALDARGAHYVMVAIQPHMDAEVPAITGVDPNTGIPTFDDVRYTDYDAILARADVAIEDARHANYAAAIATAVGGIPIDITRGWVSVVATVGGQKIRFVSTHLEVQGFEPIQVAQAQELLGTVANETLPVVMVGDYNSAGDGSQTPSYGMIRGAGFIDPWAQVHPGAAGFTCCEAADLRNAIPQLDQRLDLVWLRDGLTGRTGRISGGVQIAIVGNNPADRTPSGLWPSDHAGVVATLTIPPQR